MPMNTRRSQRYEASMMGAILPHALDGNMHYNGLPTEKLTGTIKRAQIFEGLGKYGTTNQLLNFMFSPSDTSNSTTSTTYTQLYPRSIFIDFDELIKISGMQLLQRFIADIKTSDAAVAAWVRITNEPFTGATPAGATRAEFSTTSTTFEAKWSDWWDVTDWTGKHEYNISFKTDGAATAYLDASFMQMAYKLV